MDTFRDFWGSDLHRSATNIVESEHLSSEAMRTDLPDFSLTDNFPRPVKRKSSRIEDDCSDEDVRSTFGTNKRTKAEYSVATPPETPAVPRKEYFDSQRTQPSTDTMAQVAEVIESQFGLEILLKHRELRLINQELAKCQVALEQLRRCHLVPYPTNCPTPEQMLDIVEGKGPAVQARPGEHVPQWAAQFGVVDGPYARHYAKWLIPDPRFDGALPGWQGVSTAAETGAEGRTTRNSFTEGTIGKRVARGMTGQKLQALPAGYPQQKDKTPCVLRRAADGLTVKLVCLDCDRGNFSSTQGFINHCRIAHKREFKSHEEAAVACGHPIDVGEIGGIVGEEKSYGSSVSGVIHPLASPDAMTSQEAHASLHSRIKESLSLYHQGKLPGVTNIPSATSLTPSANDKKPSKSFVGASATPYLTQLMHRRNSDRNLKELVDDAKVKMDMDEPLSPADEYDDNEDVTVAPNKASAVARVPAMRTPASTVSPPPTAPGAPLSSSKGRSPYPRVATTAPILPSSTSTIRDEYDSRLDHDLMDVDRSPIPSVSNNAPSLVSDDGEYDDSEDDGTSSSGDGVDAESEITEINIEEDSEVQYHRGSASGSKGESKHVTLVGTINGNTKKRRRQKS